jgi:GMP synthase-like glutamine amidotransferase
MRVLIVQNDETEGLGLYERYLKESMVSHTIFHAYDLEPDDDFPPAEFYDAFIVGPTPISANDVEDHEFLRREWEFLGALIESGKPVLGVCCGGQMLARRLGAEVVRSPEKEVGGYEVRLTEEAWRTRSSPASPRSSPSSTGIATCSRSPRGGACWRWGSPAPSRPSPKVT